MVMKIVVLDGYTLYPGDISWEKLLAIAPTHIYDRTPDDSIIERSIDAEILLTNKTSITSDIIANLPKLRYIGVLATGYNVVDIIAASAKGVIVTNIPAYGTNSVAQHTFALILEISNQVGHHSETVHQGHWSKSKDWCYWSKSIFELNGLTLGIVGYGRIGKSVAGIATAFGLEVLVHDNIITTDYKMVALEELLKNSDIITLHCPLTSENNNLINVQRIGLMKSSAYLINTARGQLVNDLDLANALNEGRIAGAALDVISIEPPPENNPLINAKNCTITPHIAWATKQARVRLLEIAVENISGFLKGQLKNVVNV